MGWFERYGIPGIYFVLFLAAFYWVIFGFPANTNTQTIVAAFALAVSASLPAGYLLSMISMRIYYWYPRSWQVHSVPWHQAGEKLCESNIMSEEIVEAEVAVLGRLKIKDQETDKRRWFQEWCTKRMDVLAINHAIIWATIMGWLVGLLGLFFLKKPTSLTGKWPYLLLLLGVSGFIVFCLILSVKLLNRQVRHALDKFFTDLKKINDKTTSPNAG